MSKVDKNEKTSKRFMAEYDDVMADILFRIGTLEQENKRIKEKALQLRKKHDELVTKLLPEKTVVNPRAQFTRDLTAFPLPLEILEELDQEILKIVDVGAFDLEGQEDLYSGVIPVYPTKVFGFEPQNKTIKITSDGKCQKIIFPWAVGDGHKKNFFKTRYRAASSMLEPNQEFLNQFLALPSMLEVESKHEIETRRLDDISEITDCDLLKIDVQGGELEVLIGAADILERATIVITEVEFAPIYHDQPLFADIDLFMRSKGYYLHNLNDISYGSYTAGMFGDLQSRMMWADAVYVKNLEKVKKQSQDKLLKALLLAHHVLRDPGLCCLILETYDDADSKKSYLQNYQSQMHLMRRCYY